MWTQGFPDSQSTFGRMLCMFALLSAAHQGSLQFGPVFGYEWVALCLLGLGFYCTS